ncbi:MAG: hypothetical protein ACKPKO_49035, partial [Candidatus Fonsibacter sp.]
MTGFGADHQQQRVNVDDLQTDLVRSWCRYWLSFRIKCWFSCMCISTLSFFVDCRLSFGLRFNNGMLLYQIKHCCS